jgi:hypothetical protein
MDAGELARRQAYAAYAPNSVASELRQSSRGRMAGGMMRFIGGFGLDLFVVAFSFLVISWAGLLAWNAGASGNLKIIESTAMMVGLIHKFSLIGLCLGVVAMALFWRGIKLLVRLA